MRPFVLTFLALLASLPACQTDPDLVLCKDAIPDPAGCTVDRGGTCDDPACGSLWGCDDGQWAKRASCTPIDGGAGGASDAPDAGPSCDASADVTIETSTTPCTPDLQLPDCPVEVALGCPGTACTTGCDQFLVCTAQGYYAVVPAAYCDDNGDLVWVDAGP